jgi:hypothetical protein
MLLNYIVVLSETKIITPPTGQDHNICKEKQTSIFNL